MFCNLECEQECLKKLSSPELMIDHLTIAWSEIFDTFGGAEKFERFVGSRKLSKFKSTIFDFDFSNPQHPKYRRKLMICYLCLQSFDKPKENLPMRKFLSDLANHLTGISEKTGFLQNFSNVDEMRVQSSM